MRRWEDNIKTDHRKILCKGVDWIQVCQDKSGQILYSVNAVMKFSV